jgi:hypothetical protein
LRSRRPHHPKGALTHQHKASHWPACCLCLTRSEGGA